MTITMQSDDDSGSLCGKGITRMESLIDAAFAFAITLLVISADRIPGRVAVLPQALKSLPAFAASSAMVVMFRYAHVGREPAHG